MNPLNVLLWLFPFRFANTYGDVWKSTNDEIWEALRHEPMSHRVGMFLRVLWDTLCHAPQEHVRAMKVAMLGPVPQMVAAGAGTWPTVMSWGRHVLPDAPRCRRELFSLLVGGWFFAALYLWVANRAHQYTSAALSTIHSGSTHNYTLTHLGGVPWFFVVLVLIAVGGLSLAWPYIKNRRGPLLGHLFSVVLGFYLSLYLLLRATLPPIADQSMEAFIRFPQSQQLLSSRPREDNPSEWTPEQLYWFDPQTMMVREDKKAIWCATRTASNNSEYQELYDFGKHDSVTRALLWAAESAALVGDGCHSTQEHVEKQNRLALRLRVATNTNDMTWLQLSRISSSHDYLASDHYAQWPRLLPNVIKVCTSIQAELFYLGQLTRNDFDKAGGEELCLNMQKGPLGQGLSALGRPVGPIAPDLLPPRWMWGSNSASLIDQGNDYRLLSPEDVEVIRTAVMEHYGLDQDGSGKETNPG